MGYSLTDFLTPASKVHPAGDSRVETDFLHACRQTNSHRKKQRCRKKDVADFFRGMAIYCFLQKQKIKIALHLNKSPEWDILKSRRI